MNYRSLQAIKNDLASGKITCQSLVSSYVEKIEKEKHLNAFLEVWGDEALAQAKLIDEKIKQGKAGKLAGMVIGIKDNLCYKGHKVSASSKILEGFESLYNATVVERLIAEDAIIIGRCNCDEFAMGSSNEKSAYGKVLNPHDNKRVPGGSSGGSTAAVAAGLCLAALGSDTGGSIRQPASFCGVVGMKPTYGRVSRYGLLAYASSFDQVGPLTNNIEDAALILEVMSGTDEYDSTLSDKPVPKYSSDYKKVDTKKLRIAYLKDCVEHTGLDPEIRAHLEKVIADLKKQGHVVEPASFPLTDYAVPTYYVLTTAEASSNLSRYSGINYGYRSSKATDLESTYKKSRTEGFGKEVKRRIMLGTFVLSSGYFDAYYSKGQKVRRLFSQQTEAILKNYDLILLPTTPGTAFTFGQNDQDPVKMYLEDIFTVQANITGLPAISLPLGKHSNGMPFGVQLMGKRHDELSLLAFSEYLMNSAT
ncbi:MAG TPA: Asp-tRNA(Asn)/Glu-tRNA(Gln) amidotransferase subunit GatA [Bacteroidia bacterium]|jgi:aspartyl-tRNA(Asn)/glutamyl-tRNA(Gln) amidotransferase subunit A|nr:Asp-tRNA(Asn)/Glu-tRNA(Gln) amidotransferase subunit GatA [Bacteroidia bacterium]